MWLQYLVRALSSIPIIVAGIEHLHGESKSGAEKKQMAMDALGLSAYVADAVNPENRDIIESATSLASRTIDGVVSVMNTAKESVPVRSSEPIKK